ncbi:hypothetical protein F383_38767 [Gossypium arboreum]|uniref:Uncharacterized protein n=1 Tax=Gossypium arboreum TaxID=29729 RepID=A0A0B0MCY8_GOSAR|nr:hypothetical protein F383_38767 [Gossypium arboreum]
MCQYCTEGYRT